MTLHYKSVSPSGVPAPWFAAADELSTCPFAAAFLTGTGDFLGTFGDCLASRGLAGLGGLGSGAFPPMVGGGDTPPRVGDDSFWSLQEWNTTSDYLGTHTL